MKMIITAGGTGGHIYPALAIIDYFKKNDKDFEVLYIGTHNRMESKIVPEHNIKYKSIKIYGFSKSNIGRDIKNIYYVIKAYNDCLKIIDEFKPDIVVGIGGYVTLPVLMAAYKRKVKYVVHEQNSIPGKTNKFIASNASKVFVSFKDSIKYFKNQDKCIFTGNPCSDNVKNKITKESLGFSKEKKLILITSGSLGSATLNNKLIDFLHLLENTKYEVLFLTGNNNEYNDLKFRNNIKVLPYLDNLSSLFNAVDLIISRAGASTLSEIISSATPSILIPSPYVANNHQYYNALSLKNNNAVVLIEEKNLEANDLYEKVIYLLDNKKEYLDMVNNLKKLQIKNSSKIIYDEIKELVNNE